MLSLVATYGYGDAETVVKDKVVVDVVEEHTDGDGGDDSGVATAKRDAGDVAGDVKTDIQDSDLGLTKEEKAALAKKKGS